MKGRMNLVVACECGTTLRVSSLDDDEVDAYREKFEAEHRWHQRVDTETARQIRNADSSTRNRSGRAVVTS